MQDFFQRKIFDIQGNAITVGKIIFEIIFPSLIAFIILSVFYFGYKMFLKRNTQYQHKSTSAKEHAENENKEKVFSTIKESTISIRRILIFLFFIIEFILIINFFGKIIPEIRLSVIFTKPFFTSGNTSISVFSIFLMFLLVYMANFISMQLKRITTELLANQKHFNKKVTSMCSSVVRYTVLLVFFFLGLPFIGIDISSLTVIFGALGLGIGFGLQDIIANYVAGIHVNLSNIISEGDRVIVNGMEGDVQKINLLNTLIRTLTQEEIIVPNKLITNQPIENLSHTDKIIDIKSTVQVSYESDLHKVRSVMKQAAQKLPYLHSPNDVFFRLQSFDDSGITVSVWARIQRAQDKWAAKSDLNMLIWEAFKEHNIDIPFPQMDLHVKQATSANALSHISVNDNTNATK